MSKLVITPVQGIMTATATTCARRDDLVDERGCGRRGDERKGEADDARAEPAAVVPQQDVTTSPRAQRRRVDEQQQHGTSGVAGGVREVEVEEDGSRHERRHQKRAIREGMVEQS